MLNACIVLCSSPWFSFSEYKSSIGACQPVFNLKSLAETQSGPSDFPAFSFPSKVKISLVVTGSQFSKWLGFVFWQRDGIIKTILKYFSQSVRVSE